MNYFQDKAFHVASPELAGKIGQELSAGVTLGPGSPADTELNPRVHEVQTAELSETVIEGDTRARTEKYAHGGKEVILTMENDKCVC